jgi:RNA polymerase sigma-54 factor
MDCRAGGLELGQGFHHTQRVETGVGLRVDPRVVLSSQILQLNQQELEQAIDTELNENPALERLESESEPINEEAILRAVAPHELRPSSEDFEFQRSLPQDDSSPDWVDLASASSTLWEHLRAQLLPALPPHLRALGEYMVECVSDKGYLTSPVEEIALECGHSLEEAELVLRRLQMCEPPGVGATNIQECLLLQLRNPDSLEQKLARNIVKHHMDEFVARRTTRIMRKYRVLPDVVESAFSEILSLSPFPGEGFHTSPGGHVSSRSVGVVADLTINRSESGWEVHVKGVDPTSLCINRAYRRRLSQLSNMERPPRDEKRHVGTYVQRAQDFISCIEQRRQTMRLIGEYLVQHQASFISTGSYRFLRPLTRSRMAADIGIHESTVSRATMDKFVQIANGEVVPFDVFFKPALRVQKMIEEILQHENPNNPLSDDAIAQMLAKEGVHVARRTVNKYRDRTKLLSSRKRRSA